MKHILLMRHAKSDWNSESLNDHERPLNKRGIQDAPKIATEIIKRGIIPELMLVSDAKRTQETWNLISPFFAGVQTKFDAELYLASPKIIQTKLEEVHHLVDTVLLLAHNPGITEAFYSLANVQIDNVPTAGVGCIRLYTDDFKTLKTCKKELVYFTYPKNL
ncbi:MAG TPA: phosphohistidine phosphatase [Bacteroidetes bacterium]|nr:phosphohistidine phosphatase [Bacteroidota bacterium]